MDENTLIIRATISMAHAMSSIRSACQRHSTWRSAYAEQHCHKLTLAYHKLSPDMMFCSELQIDPCGWVTFENPAPCRWDIFSTQRAISTKVKPSNNDTAAPVLLLSYDIETVPEAGASFPQSCNTFDKIVQIAVSFGVLGKGIVKNAVICLGETGPVDDVVIISCASEMEVLQTFQQMIRHTDPDIITGFNIFGYDNYYVGDRALRIEMMGSATEQEVIDAWLIARDVKRDFDVKQKELKARPPKSMRDKQTQARRSGENFATVSRLWWRLILFYFYTRFAACYEGAS